MLKGQGKGIDRDAASVAPYRLKTNFILERIATGKNRGQAGNVDLGSVRRRSIQYFSDKMRKELEDNRLDLTALGGGTDSARKTVVIS